MSSPHYGRHRTVAEVERMFDIIVENEGEPDVIQISGGEPTLHPDFFEILDLQKQNLLSISCLIQTVLELQRIKHLLQG